MDRENENSLGRRDQPNAIPTEGVVVSVAPPRPAVPSSYWDKSVVLAAAHPAPLMRDQSPSHDFALPLPLVPSKYAYDQRMPVELPIPRPSVHATLPPLQIEVLKPQHPVLRATQDIAPPIDASQLTLAPEAHFPRGDADSCGRDPTDMPARAASPAVNAISPVLPAPALPRAEASIPRKSFSAAPVRIEPVFAPRQATPDRDALAVAPDVSAPSAPVHSTGYYVQKAAKYAVYAAAAYLALIAFLILAYRFVNPPMSSLMLQQWISGQAIQQSWADIDEISPQVVRAVLLSEDGRFCDHTGVDFDAMQDAIERAGDGAPRGASTISMQVVKNLFLWPSKSYLRKAIEIPLTWAMELVWPKRRIMEIYLNIAEWGQGIFGVEAASQFHFQKSARRLNEREAAQLAVSLPNPYTRDAGDPGPKTRRLASDIQARMRNAYASQTACVLRAGAGR